MKKSQIKRILRDEAVRTVPDVRERVLSVVPTKSERKPRTKWAAVIAACCMCAVVLAVVLPLALSGNGAPMVALPDHATVCLKINPSVELTVKDGNVTAARALNTDGARMLSGVNLVGLTAENASLTVADIAARSSYLTADGITVRVVGKDETALAAAIEAALGQSYTVRVDRADVKAVEDAARYGVTAGFMQLVYAVREKDASLSVERLVRLDADDLLDILEDYDEAEMEAYEQQLQSEFAAQFEHFVGDVKALLNDYIAALNLLKSELGELDDGQLTARIAQLNEQFIKLGSDYALELDDIDDLDEYIEDAEETLLDIDEDADEVFEEMYEEWLDEFRGASGGV